MCKKLGHFMCYIRHFYVKHNSVFFKFVLHNSIYELHSKLVTHKVMHSNSTP